jgi:hypothetical protein
MIRRLNTVVSGGPLISFWNVSCLYYLCLSMFQPHFSCHFQPEYDGLIKHGDREKGDWPSKDE